MTVVSVDVLMRKAWINKLGWTVKMAFRWHESASWNGRVYFCFFFLSMHIAYSVWVRPFLPSVAHFLVLFAFSLTQWVAFLREWRSLSFESGGVPAMEGNEAGASGGTVSVLELFGLSVWFRSNSKRRALFSYNASPHCVFARSNIEMMLTMLINTATDSPHSTNRYQNSRAGCNGGILRFDSGRAWPLSAVACTHNAERGRFRALIIVINRRTKWTGSTENVPIPFAHSIQFSCSTSH